MIETTPEGFKILVGTDGSKQFMIDSNRIDECIAFIRKNDLTYIGINSFIGFKSLSLDFLLDLADFVEGISIPEDHFDISVLNNLHKLVFLGFADDRKSDIDLSNFPHLSKLACEYTSRLHSLEACEELRDLSLTNFKPEKANLSQLPVLTSLQSLSLFVTNIDSLTGIEKFRHLESCSIYKASKLENITALSNVRLTLKSLELENCKKIKSYDALNELVELERLIISKSSPLRSVKFVKSLDRLDFFSFVGTNVEDGDLSPCVGLSYVGFDDRKHYNRKFKASAV